MLPHVRLYEDRGLPWVEPAGEVRRDSRASLLCKNAGFVSARSRQSVQVNDAEEAIVLTLVFGPRLEGPEVVAKVQVACRLDARQHSPLRSSLCLCGG